MQASPALNETRLPRQVLQRSKAIEDRIAARKAESEAASALPAETPSADPANPAPPATPAPPTDPRHSDPAYWKHRFEATAGRLRVREDEHKAELAALRGQIDELQGQVRSLQATSTPPAAEINLTEFFSPEQIKDIGEDDAKSIAQAAMTAAMKTAKTAIEAEIQPLRDQRKADAEEQFRQRKAAFVEKLEEQIPNYAAIDAEPAWLEWLAEEDADSGLQRQKILDRHIAALDAAKVAKVFRNFLKTQERPAPPVAPNGSAAGGGGEVPPQPNAADVVAPTSAEVKDFYKRASLGRVSDAERAKFEARLKLRAGR